MLRGRCRMQQFSDFRKVVTTILPMGYREASYHQNSTSATKHEYSHLKTKDINQ